MTLVTIVAQNDNRANDLFAFADDLIASQWWHIIGQDYGLGAAARSVHWTGPAISPTQAGLSEPAILQYIGQAISSNTALGANEKPVYVLYLPEGVVINKDGVLNTNCSRFDAWHSSYNSGSSQWAWAVIQRCPQAQGTEEQFKRVTALASHEIEEAATNPFGTGFQLGVVPATRPWTEDIWLSFPALGQVETADLCEGTRIKEGRWWYQRNWSNTAARAGRDPCVPAISVPYVSVAPRQGWTSASRDIPVAIPLAGWSTAKVSDWQVTASIVRVSSTFMYRWSITSDTSTTIAGKQYATVNNGHSASLNVTMGANAPSGSFVVFHVFSSSRTADGNLPMDGDRFHISPVGVYVP